jgi:Glyoxalase-like domain
MAIELDHVFICVAQGAPEAEYLVEFGLCEGAPNVHPGQGTANRRFFFQNAMLELLWVEDPQEAQSSQTSPTLLWERWSNRQSGACPFGIIARPANTPTTAVPFPAREYLPEWLAPGLKIYLAPTGLEEPMWLFMPFLQRHHHEQHFVAHPNRAREITKLTLTTPAPLRSSAAQALVDNAVLSIREGSEYLLTIELNKGLRQVVRDFRPHLPLVVQL